MDFTTIDGLEFRDRNNFLFTKTNSGSKLALCNREEPSRLLPLSEAIILCRRHKTEEEEKR